MDTQAQKKSFAKPYVWLLAVSMCCGACASVQLAERYRQKGEFESALVWYRKAIERHPERSDLYFGLAECFRQSNRMKQALPFYQSAYEKGLRSEALLTFYAQSLKANGRYAEAMALLRAYLANHESASRARVTLEHLEALQDIRQTTHYYEVRPLHQLNTVHAEYAPVYKKGKLYFTSSREGGKLYKGNNTPFTDIYRVNMPDTVPLMETVTPVDKVLNLKNVHEGSVTFSPSGKTMIFSRGNTGKGRGYDEVNIFMSRYRRRRWQEPRVMSFNDLEAWDSTPCLAPGGRTLYFASTREGNYGGTDLYKVSRRGRRWGKAENLGPVVNTPGDELFPYLAPDGTLYFSSNGHPGFGNLDIFVRKKEAEGFRIENLGEPINSAGDDFGLFFKDEIHGFFSSNRAGGLGDDDIYVYVNHDPAFKTIHVSADVQVFKTDSAQSPIPSARVAFFDAEGQSFAQGVTDAQGHFRCRVYEAKEYFVRAEKVNFFARRVPFRTPDRASLVDTLRQREAAVVFPLRIALTPIVVLKPVLLRNIYYDLDKAHIRPDAAQELDKLVELMRENPDIEIEISSHTDSRADDDYNLALSARRAIAVVEYLVFKGIARKRLSSRGYGETQMLFPQARSEEAHQQNRRTEFKVTKYDPAKILIKEEGEDENDSSF